MISDNEEESVLIACFFCERQLRVPMTYSGRIRCPTCSKEFLVEGSNELKIDEVIPTDEKNKQALEKIEDSPEIEIIQNPVGGFEFVIGLIIPPIPPIIILILLFGGINFSGGSPDIMGLVYFMCSLICWPIIGFSLAMSSNIFVKNFRKGAQFSAVISLIIVGLIWLWFIGLISGGITN
ncbi:MAG: hypothetical protein CL983_05455 [Euryarchaeota archaeon]|nr:hypothetical protein [Euryarchaeota archaeon]